MDDKFLELINSKQYADLSESEKKEFQELFSSEDEFDALKQFYENFEGYKNTQEFSTHYMTKGSLDEIFISNHPKRGMIQKLFPTNKPFYFNPLMQVAAVLLVAILVYQFRNNESDHQQIAISSTKQENKTSAQEENLKKVEKNQTESTIKNEKTPVDNSIQIKEEPKILVARARSTSMENTNLDFELSQPFAGDDSIVSEESISGNTLTSTFSSVASSSVQIDAYFGSHEIKKESDQTKKTNKPVNNTRDLFDLLVPVY